MVIRLTDYISSCYSNEDGEVIYDLLNKHFKSGDSITLSFMGINSITSSFTNTAFIEFLKDYDFNYIRKHLNFTDTNKQINSMIKNRFEFESRRIKENELSLV